MYFRSSLWPKITGFTGSILGKSSESQMSPDHFATTAGIGLRAAQIAFHSATVGKPWRGHQLPVVALPGHRGGASGMVRGLSWIKASPDLRALLNLPETRSLTPVRPRLKMRPDDWHVATSSDKRPTIGPILAHRKRSHERAEAFRVVARKQHRIVPVWQTF